MDRWCEMESLHPPILCRENFVLFLRINNKGHGVVPSFYGQHSRNKLKRRQWLWYTYAYVLRTVYQSQPHVLKHQTRFEYWMPRFSFSRHISLVYCLRVFLHLFMQQCYWSVSSTSKGATKDLYTLCLLIFLKVHIFLKSKGMKLEFVGFYDDVDHSNVFTGWVDSVVV